MSTRDRLLALADRWQDEADAVTSRYFRSEPSVLRYCSNDLRELAGPEPAPAPADDLTPEVLDELESLHAADFDIPTMQVSGNDYNMLPWVNIHLPALIALARVALAERAPGRMRYFLGRVEVTEAIAKDAEQHGWHVIQGGSGMVPKTHRRPGERKADWSCPWVILAPDESPS